MTTLQNENTDNSISVKDAALGEFILHIPEKPIWFGEFHSGKLSIFLADMEGETKMPCFGLIYVISEQEEEGFNGMGFAMYSFLQAYDIAVTHLLAQLTHSHLVRTVEVRDADKITLH